MRFNSLVPELSVSDLGRSLVFYKNILGFREEYCRPESRFAFLSLGRAQLMIQENNGKWETAPLRRPYGRGVNFQIEVKSASAIASALKRNRWPVKVPVHDNWYRKGRTLLGCRELLVEDPDGYLLRFSEDIGTRRPGKMDGA